MSPDYYEVEFCDCVSSGKLTQNFKPRWLGQSTIIESEELTEQIFQNFKENILGPFFPFQFLFVMPLSSKKMGEGHHFIFVHLLI